MQQYSMKHDDETRNLVLMMIVIQYRRSEQITNFHVIVDENYCMRRNSPLLRNNDQLKNYQLKSITSPKNSHWISLSN